MADGPRHLQRGPVRVGFYDIEGTLGKGNFAVVKLGRHRITKTEVRPGARRERPRRGFGRAAVYREGRLQWGPGETQEAGSVAGTRRPGTVTTWEVQGIDERLRDRGPASRTRASDWKPDQPRLRFPYATHGGHTEFRLQSSTLVVTWSVASAREPKFRVFPAFGWGWGGRGSLSAPGLRGGRRRQPRGGDRLRSDCRDGASRVPGEPGPMRKGPPGRECPDGDCPSSLPPFARQYL